VGIPQERMGLVRRGKKEGIECQTQEGPRKNSAGARGTRLEEKAEEERFGGVRSEEPTLSAEGAERVGHPQAHGFVPWQVEPKRPAQQRRWGRGTGLKTRHYTVKGREQGL
jgi:hypothetical protein